jgi:HrpA-like RNA helicase
LTLDEHAVPNVWLRPNTQRKEADVAKALLTIPDGDHLTMMNVYNNYVNSMAAPRYISAPGAKRTLSSSDKDDKNWCWKNYLSQRALQQAENVRQQLERSMERFDLDLVGQTDLRKLHISIRQALVCGFFMQVAHRSEKNTYVTVKDNQVRRFTSLANRNEATDNWRVPLGRVTSPIVWIGQHARVGTVQRVCAHFAAVYPNSHRRST